MARLLSSKRFLSFLLSSSSSSSINCCYTTSTSMKSVKLLSPPVPSVKLLSPQVVMRSFTPSPQPLGFRNVLPGCDFKHWLILMHHPSPDLSRDDIISNYIKTLATVVGSQEKARMKIYSVSTRYYYAFGAEIPHETASKMKGLENVRLVLPDSYMDESTKDYGGEPFVNGQPVPYDPKYHEVYLENMERAKKFLMQQKKQRQQNPGLPFMGGGFQGMTGGPESWSEGIKKKQEASEPAKKKRHTPVFLVFMEDFRRTYKEEHPEIKSVVEIAKEGSKKWRSLTDKEKEQYFYRAVKKEVKSDDEGDTVKVKV